MPRIGTKGEQYIQEWLKLNDVPNGYTYNVKYSVQVRLSYAIKKSNLAIFPNRAEGGTNLFAMETLSCHVPTILSNNTGHQDIINHERAIILNKQIDIGNNNLIKNDQAYNGWKESSVDEIVDRLLVEYDKYVGKSNNSNIINIINKTSLPSSKKKNHNNNANNNNNGSSSSSSTSVGSNYNINNIDRYRRKKELFITGVYTQLPRRNNITIRKQLEQSKQQKSLRTTTTMVVVDENFVVDKKKNKKNPLLLNMDLSWKKSIENFYKVLKKHKII